MAYEQKDMSGALFKNARKTKESHPDYRGDVTIEGHKYELVGWLRKSQKSGATFLSLKVSEPRERGYSREDNFE